MASPTPTHPPIRVVEISTWSDLVRAIDYLSASAWVFRGHDDADLTLKTSLERQTHTPASVENVTYWHFVRHAPRFLPAHLVPADEDAAAWLGLIQHYGGPTRLLDVTRSPYVGLLFAYEALGEQDRALWAIDSAWCAAESARTMSDNESINLERAFERVSRAQAQLVYSLFHRSRHPDPIFASFSPFAGVFPLEPWKPDARQSAQQALFLCTADVSVGFMQNMAAHSFTEPVVIYKFVLPAALRDEIVERLTLMSVTAATLFPGLDGLARSLRTLRVRRIRNADASPPWDVER